MMLSYQFIHNWFVHTLRLTHKLVVVGYSLGLGFVLFRTGTDT